MKTLLVTEAMPPDTFLAAIATAAPDLEVTAWQRGMDPSELAQYSVVLSARLNAELLAGLTSLRWLCALGAGVERLLIPELPAHVPVSRIVDPAQSEGIAQYVVLAALHHMRGMPQYALQQSRRQWVRSARRALARVGLLGRGRMGAAIAAQLRPLGFEVLEHSRSGGESLDTVLRESDIVVCALPLTPATEGILHTGTFALMKPGSYLINIARGAHVVEDDLVPAAVRSGHLSGAALDVFRSEPLPAWSPLWDTPGIIVTPHIAAQPALRTTIDQYVDGMRRLAAGLPPLNQVDRTAGY